MLASLLATRPAKTETAPGLDWLTFLAVGTTASLLIQRHSPRLSLTLGRV